MSYFPAPIPQPVTATAGDFAVTAVGIVGVTQATSPWVTTSTISGISTVTGTVFATLAGTSVVAGVVSATQGTSPWIVAGTVSATQGTSPWVVSAAAIGATQSGVWAVNSTVTSIPGVGPTGTTAPTTAIVNGIIVSGTLQAVSSTFPMPVSGALSATQGTYPWVVSAAAVGVTQSTSPWVISGAVSSTQGTVPWSVNATQFAGITLGATAVTNYGSSPAAVIVPGVNAFVTNTVTIANTGVYGTVSATQGTSPWVVSGAVSATQGTSPWVVSAAAIGATQSGNWTSRIVGNAGAIVDATTTAGSAPANGLVALAICTTNTVTTTVGNAQSIAQQCDYVGNHFVRPFRRSQISPVQLATLSTTTAQTLFTAGATGVYKDISNLIITPLANATTSLPFVVNVTDGTTTYHFNLQTGSAASTAGQALAGTNVVVNFNPPLPQSTTATTWMVNLNVTTCTCAIVAAAVQSMIN